MTEAEIIAHIEASPLVHFGSSLRIYNKLNQLVTSALPVMITFTTQALPFSASASSSFELAQSGRSLMIAS